MSKRCITVTLNGAGVWISLVQVNTPTDNADNPKNEYYAEVQAVMNGIPRGHRAIVMNNFNAKSR